jgi:hypothetical protein
MYKNRRMALLFDYICINIANIIIIKTLVSYLPPIIKMSTGVGMSPCCLSGNVHEGTPTGTVETIDNLKTYVAAPKDGSKAKSIVFLVDSESRIPAMTAVTNKLLVFGWEFKNVRLLADSYAKAGFYCYIPDIHQGDSLPIEFLQSVEPPCLLGCSSTARLWLSHSSIPSSTAFEQYQGLVKLAPLGFVGVADMQF